MRTPIEALKEIRDRLTYFCLRTDGKYDPPWVTELVGIIDESVKGCNHLGNAAAMRKALLNIQEYAAAMDVDDGNVLAILDACRDALAAPARNCDGFNTRDPMKDAEDAFGAWQRYCDDPAIPPSCKIESAFKQWLFAPAAERKGE